LWEWRNEETTRETSFNSDAVHYEDHEAWFSRKLIDPATRIFIVEDGSGVQVGYVRFDIEDDHAEISVSLDKTKRGKGYGPTSIREGSDHLMASGSVKKVVALVKSTNLGSLAAFQRAGFIIHKTKQVSGTDATELIYDGSLR